MKAVKIFNHGSPEVLQYTDLEIPQISSSEVLVKVKACALNHLDLWARRGLPKVVLPLPLTPGCDISGVVEEIGSEVKNTKPGERVMISPGVSCGTCENCLLGEDNLCPEYKILGYLADGGYAEYVRVPKQNIISLPEELSFEEGAAIPLVFVTAWHMLKTRAKLLPGETVLVQAAGSGVGIAGIQIAKLLGAKVITTAGTEEKLQKAKELGADEVINYREQDFVKEVRALTGKKGVDVVFEHIGGETFEKSIMATARNGRIVTCGATENPVSQVDLRQLFYRHLTFYGSYMGTKGELLEVVKFFRENKLKSIVDRVFDLREASDAHRYLEERKQFGKVVLKI